MKIEEFVNSEMDHLKLICRQMAATNGLTVEYMCRPRDLCDLYKDGVHRSFRETVLAITELFEVKLATMCCSRSEVQFSGLWHITVCWGDVTEPEVDAALQPTGIEMECRVCLENAPAVALMPCGHTVCRGCASHLSRKPCPWCHKQVIGSTVGLFMES